MTHLAYNVTHTDPAIENPLPHNDTLVLFDRELVPGTDPAALSRFGEDRWHLNEAVFEADAQAISINFAMVPAPLRLTMKHLIWQMINTDCPVPMNRATVSRYSIRTIKTAWSRLLAFTIWLHEHHITELRQVTAELLDDYLIEIAGADMPVRWKFRQITDIRRLWSYRSTVPEAMRLPPPMPWGGDRAAELFGKSVSDRHNLTPRITENTMQSLLLWSLRFVEDLSEDILAAHAERMFLRGRDLRPRRDAGLVRSPRGQVDRLAAEYVDRLRGTGGMLPGRKEPDGTIGLHWTHLGRIFECAYQGLRRRKGLAKFLLESGIPIADDAYLEAPITARLDGRLWRDRTLTYTESLVLARHLSTACSVIIAYLSGARVGEVLNLRRGCIDYDSATGLWLMSGLYFKNAVGDDGNKIPAGALRRDPWVVVEPVARAVAVLERMHDHEVLFPTQFDHQRYSVITRVGQARTSVQAAVDLTAFIDWVNAYSLERGISGVPDDPHGSISMSRFRRTLAWFLRRRPRGVVAGALQYSHVETRIFQGYAGDLASGFPDDYAFEDFLARIDELAEDHRALQTGERVSGPAADNYRLRISAAHKQFAGHVLTTGKHARDLLGNPLLQIFHGKGMTCVFDATKAACQLRGSADDPLTTPDISDCRPRCPNIARTDRDITEIRTRRDELAEIISDPLAPPIRHQREQNELDRLDTILENHR
ncbi:hypothetical protein [Nocardia terpenica]|uniref:Integrase n=1 Tax=Nocardia terpenica TaxID=455432 RepID=A0A291RQ24_9NOCA|nr:hypothetical protein [Nocardia terpenica]ATL69437.1 hypothetical protein CRH09_27905 [Nocardia terpenica]ATL72515.1 hypothetical protein CRH09_39785 [Nocardia terpenica]